MAGSPASSPNSFWPATESTTSRAGSSRGPPAGTSKARVDGDDLPARRYPFPVRRRQNRLRDLRRRLGRRAPGRRLARRGVDLILNPSASHFAFGKTKVREQFVLEAARSFGVSYIYANLLGNEAGRAIYDGNALIASADRVVALGKRFSFADYAVTCAVIDLDAARLHRGRSMSVETDPLPSGDDCIAAPFEFPDIAPAPRVRSRQRSPRPGSPVGPTRPRSSSQEPNRRRRFTRAVSLALFDYLRKSHSQGFVVSISGGADSAAVTCLVGLMVRLGVAEFGHRRLRREACAYPRPFTAPARRPTSSARSWPASTKPRETAPTPPTTPPAPSPNPSAPIS